ncbi:MAG: oligosaccharide flippase family protein [Lachnospiraceae bacterium]|nr:oligosaccharide flippase family protein [uncultured Acetatifactor sp.]MCI8790872.1 oligosaccharide flippase family protein [Lachnospiraceae bacterium]
MGNNNVKAVKSGIWYTISNLLVKGIGFLTTPIFTRLLSHAEFGAYNNYISWLSFLTIFITLNLESTLISARYDYKQHFDDYIFSMLALSSINTLVWILMVNLFQKAFTNFLELDLRYINIMLIYSLFTPAITMFQRREMYFFEYKKNVLTSVFLAVGTAILSVLLVINLPDRLTGRILGAALPSILLGALFYAFFIIRGQKVKVSYWKYAIPICLPYIPHLLSMTLLNSMDRVMITKFCGSEQTALYSLAYTCGTMITLLLTSLNSAYIPWLGEKLVEEKYAEIKRFSYSYILIFLYLSIGIMLVSPEILLILGGEKYMEAVYVLAPVSMGCVCQFLYVMLVNVEQLKKRTIGMAAGSGSAAIVNLILNYLLIPMIGYLAAAYTTLVGYIVLLGIHMYLVYRLKLSRIYDYKFMILVVVAGIFGMIGINIMYSHTFIRYIILGIYSISVIAFLYKNKNRILEFLIKRRAKNTV